VKTDRRVIVVNGDVDKSARGNLDSTRSPAATGEKIDNELAVNIKQVLRVDAHLHPHTASPIMDSPISVERSR
jgi:hypothetical protein